MLDLINRAEYLIHLQTYIFCDDATGEKIAEALRCAARRNVRVFLLVDGYASQDLSIHFIQSLRTAGINFRFFQPLLKSEHLYFGRRMHHKIFVADAKFALVGGINIADRYNDMAGHPAWLDFAVFVSGPAAAKLSGLCGAQWGQLFRSKNGVNPGMAIAGHTGKPVEHNNIVIRRNDWVKNRNEISKTYTTMLRSARSEVVILCSYFLPGKMIRRSIVASIRRGVSIKVIAAGSSDVPMAKWAERWLYDWLLRNGVELYEYQKNVLHGKLAVCDDQWMTIGSYNINDISAYASLELNLDIFDPLFAQQVRKKLEDIRLDDCVKITQERHNKTKNVFVQLLRWSSYQFIRMVFHLCTFYFKQEVKSRKRRLTAPGPGRI